MEDVANSCAGVVEQCGAQMWNSVTEENKNIYGWLYFDSLGLESLLNQCVIEAASQNALTFDLTMDEAVTLFTYNFGNLAESEFALSENTMETGGEGTETEVPADNSGGL